MSLASSADALVAELLANPSKFEELGRAYNLLQEYFRGYPVDTLRPLLGNSDLLIQSTAVLIASELGDQACDLLQDVIPLTKSSDEYIKYHALAIVIVCAIGDDAGEFVHVARALESDNEFIRVTAMTFTANAHPSQLDAGLRFVGTVGGLGRGHQKGLEQLSRLGSLTAEDIRLTLEDADPLTRRYGAVAAKRLMKRFPGVIASAAECADSDIRTFAIEALEDARIVSASPLREH